MFWLLIGFVVRILRVWLVSLIRGKVPDTDIHICFLAFLLLKWSSYMFSQLSSAKLNIVAIRLYNYVEIWLYEWNKLWFLDWQVKRSRFDEFLVRSCDVYVFFSGFANFWKFNKRKLNLYVCWKFIILRFGVAIVGFCVWLLIVLQMEFHLYDLIVNFKSIFVLVIYVYIFFTSIISCNFFIWQVKRSEFVDLLVRFSDSYIFEDCSTSGSLTRVAQCYL